MVKVILDSSNEFLSVAIANEESIIGLLWFIIGIDIERLLRCGSILDQQPLETSHSSESYQLTGFSLSSES